MKTRGQKIKGATQGLLIAVLAYLTVEILWRRWIFNQIPSQLPAAAVYGLLAINSVFLSVFLYRRRAAWLPGRVLSK